MKNNKNKKSIIIVIIITVIITAIISSLITILCCGKSKNIKNDNKNISNAEYGLQEIKIIDYNIPDFSIITTGLYISVVNQNSLINTKKYEITAIISDSIYKRKYTYKGVRVKDLVDTVDFDDYNKIIFKSNGGLQVEYTKEELNNLFLVFEKDGIHYPEKEPVSLLNPTVYDRYNITNIEKMEFAK